MAINPIAFARMLNEQFLRYQPTAFPTVIQSQFYGSPTKAAIMTMGMR